MIPLYELEMIESQQGNNCLTYAVHKHNAYIPGRTITLEEAAKCVVHQSKWATSHDLVRLPDMGPQQIDVKVISEEMVDAIGKIVTLEIESDEKNINRHVFTVTESESHWFFSIIQWQK